MNVAFLINKIKDSSKGYPDNIFRSEGGTVSFINPMQYCLARKHKEIYGDLDYVFVDGFTIVKMIGLIYRIKIKRLSFDMTTMARDLFEKLNDSDKTIYFIGTEPGVVDRAIDLIKRQYPNLNILGYRNGYFKDPEERLRSLKQIIGFDPDYTIVGLGSVRQEEFVRDLKQMGYKGTAITCGGFLHQTSNGIKYYPQWIDKYNLRAIYRIFKEKGMYKRLKYVLFWMPLYFLTDSFATKQHIAK